MPQMLLFFVSNQFQLFLFRTDINLLLIIIYYENFTIGMDKTILIVEDDEVLIGIYKEILELYDYEVQTALNGVEGVEKFKQIKPSLVILDVNMPGVDGYDTFKQIKEIDKNSNVVIVTSSAEFESKSQEAIKQGLIKVILKPILVDELLKLAKKYTELKLEKRFGDMEEVMLELTVKTNKFLKNFIRKNQK